MKISYDPRYNIAYMALREKTDAAIETLHLSDEINIDLAPNGEIYGIELLNANAVFGASGPNVLQFLNSAAGIERSFELS